MKNKKIQLIALGLLLVVVIAAGLWLILRTPGQEAMEPPAAVEQPEAENKAALFDMSNVTPMHFTLQERTEEIANAPAGPLDSFGQILSYEGQFCLLTYRPGQADGGFAVDVVSMLSGETLHSFPAEEFPNSYGSVELGDSFIGLTLDENGVLWALYMTGEDDSAEYFITPCGPDAAEDCVISLGSLGLFEGRPAKFLVWNGYAIMRDLGYGRLVAAGLSDGAYGYPAGEQAHVLDFCLDEDGNLYYVGEAALPYAAKYSLTEEKLLWSKEGHSLEIPFYLGLNHISYTASGGLFIQGADDPTDLGGIHWIDPEDVGAYHELIDLRLDVDEPPAAMTELSLEQPAFFAVDAAYRIYYSEYQFDHDAENPEAGWRSVWILEPEICEADPDAAVTLTVTAPYPVESLDNAIRVYQRLHPEVEVVWDTQYVSREEFQKNMAEYLDQIALRTMTGDVGDIQMVLGSGLGQDVITDTDAFLDLSGYLENCSFREELAWNVFEALRGEDGAIRAVPVATVPNYYVWNLALLEELGNPFDPDTVTWSELLDLALQWKADGTDLSLMTADSSLSSMTEENMLYAMLLANLYDAEQANGTVQLDQPYLRELLTKWSELHGSTQLVRGDGAYSSEKALLASATMTNYARAINNLMASETELGSGVYAATLPKGEVNKKQQGYAFCWGISAFSENQDAAWDLLEYFISSEGLPSYSYSLDTTPANTAAQENWFDYMNTLSWNGTGETETARTYFEQLCALQEIPYNRLDEPYGWRTAVYEPIRAYINGEMTLDEALKTANANWERFVLE